MFTSFRKGRRGRSARQIQKLTSCLRRCRYSIEPLEQRTLLSVSFTSLIDRYLQTGNRSTYQLSGDQGVVGTLTSEVKGPTTFEGHSVIQYETPFPNGITEFYYSTDIDGNLIAYGGTVHNDLNDSTTTSVYTPYQIIVPATLTAGVPSVSSYSETDTFTVSGGTPNVDTSTGTISYTLQSETTTPVTVPKGTFDTYQITTVETRSSSSPSTTQSWYSPSVALVKSIDHNGLTSVLTDFTSNKDHLAFSHQPQNGTAANSAINPPVSVEVDDADGNVDPAASGTVTLSLNPFSRSGTGTLGGTLTVPLVGGVATFSDLKISQNGVYQLHAEDSNADPGVNSNKFKVGPSTLKVQLNSRAPKHKGGGVITGDPILYSFLVSPLKAVQDQTITIDLPHGLVPEHLTGGATFVDGTITCTVNTTHAINFDITVPDAKTLSAALQGQTSINLTANVDVTYADTTTDSGTASNSVKVAIDRSIEGKLQDVLFEASPQGKAATKLSLSSGKGLGGIEVDLTDSDNAIVATSVTKKDGSFSVVAPKEGTYTVVFNAVTDVYSSAADGISNQHIYLGKSVTMEQANTVPLDAGTLLVPRTFFATAAKILQSLNHYTTSGFQGLEAFKLDLLKFDTTSAEAAITSLAGTADNPVTPLDPLALKAGVATNPWIGAFRMMAGLASVDSRFSDTFKITDQMGKILAVMASAQVAKRIDMTVGKLSKKFPKQLAWMSDSVSTAQKKLNTATRATVLTSLGIVLSPLLDALGVPGNKKAPIMAVSFNLLRYGSEIFTGKLAGDLGFELAFNLVRVAFDSALMNVICGTRLRDNLPSPFSLIAPVVNGAASVGTIPNNFQDKLNASVSERIGYDASRDTASALAQVNDFNAFYHSEALKGMRNTSIFNTLNGLFRLSTGVIELQDVAAKIDPSLPLGQFQKSLQSVATNFNTYAEKVHGGTLGSLQARTQAILFATTTFSVLQQLYGAGQIPDLVSTGVWGGPATPSIARPEPSQPSQQQQPARALPALARKMHPAAAVGSDAAVYIADLTQFMTLVKKNDTAGITTLYSKFAADDSALFSDDLVPLHDQAGAVLAQLDSRSADLYGKFSNALDGAVTATLLAQTQVDAWGLDPATGNSKTVIAQLKAAIKAVTSAASTAASLRPVVAPQPVPLTLVIAESDVPVDMTAGTTAPFTFTVTNISGQSSEAGTIAFSNSNASLLVQGAAQQTLPALGPGESATITWQVQAVTPSDPSLGSTFEVQANAGGIASSLSDQVIVD